MKKENIKNKGEIIIYQTSGKEVDLKVRLEDENIWLDVYQIDEVFGIDRTGVIRHIQNIYKTDELSRKSTCAKIAQVAKDGKTRNILMRTHGYFSVFFDKYQIKHLHLYESII